jgi:hypothetical protein
MKTLILCLAAFLTTAAAPLAPAASDLPALAKLEPGQWTLTSRDVPTASRKLCMADARAFVQIEHRNASCSRFVIASNPKEATVHYTCPGQGHGRTTVRTESARLAQIETQGITGGAPFSESFEARRSGDCPSVTGLLTR